MATNANQTARAVPGSNDVTRPAFFPAEMDRFQTVTLRGEETKVDRWAFPIAALEYVIAYGVQRALNDAGGSEGDKADQRKKSLDKLASLYSGEVRQSFTRTSDPVAQVTRTEAEADATRYINAALKPDADDKVKAWGVRAAEGAKVAFPFQGKIDAETKKQDPADRAANKQKAVRWLADYLVKSDKFGPAIKARAEKIVAERDADQLPDFE